MEIPKRGHTLSFFMEFSKKVKEMQSSFHFKLTWIKMGTDCQLKGTSMELLLSFFLRRILKGMNTSLILYV